LKTAFIFPGQGVDDLVMDACRGLPEAKRLVERAGRIAGVDPWERNPRHLDLTEVLQPLLTAQVLGIDCILRSLGLRPDAVAGHSLGEIAAWSAAGVISREEAVDLAALRGRLMARQAKVFPGGMLALLVEDPGPAVELGRRHGSVEVAARNAPREWVLSGDGAALGAVAASFSSVPLRVAGPWHGTGMEGAVDELRRAVAAAERRPPAVALVSGSDGRIVESPGEMPETVAGMLLRPVDWVRTLGTILDLGVTDLVTIGPGKVMRGLVRKNLGGRVRVHAASTPESIRRLVEVMRS